MKKYTHRKTFVLVGGISNAKQTIEAMKKENIENFRITRMENEIEFFKKTTTDSIQNNGKKIDRILTVLEADESIGERGLVKDVKQLKREVYKLKGIASIYKVLAGGIAALLTGVGLYFKNR